MRARPMAPMRFRIAALTAQTNVEALAEQARAFRPRLAVIGDANALWRS